MNPAGARPRSVPGLAPVLAIAAAVAYPFLSHAASARDSGALAAAALGAIVLMVLAERLVRLRPLAWLALAGCALALVALARSDHAQTPLLLVPVAFIGLVAWSFGRTLRPPRVPLITRIVAALDGRPPQALEPALRDYSRRLTLVWTLALSVLALCNLALAAVAVPRGLLASVGVAPPVRVTETQWSWFANWLNYGLVGGLFFLEYLYRKRRFPGRYRSFLDFLRKMARLDLAFWRGLFR